MKTEQIEKEIETIKEVLGTFITWMVMELGEKGVDDLLDKLNNDQK